MFVLFSPCFCSVICYRDDIRLRFRLSFLAIRCPACAWCCSSLPLKLSENSTERKWVTGEGETSINKHAGAYVRTHTIASICMLAYTCTTAHVCVCMRVCMLVTRLQNISYYCPRISMHTHLHTYICTCVCVCLISYWDLCWLYAIKDRFLCWYFAKHTLIPSAPHRFVPAHTRTHLHIHIRMYVFYI